MNKKEADKKYRESHRIEIALYQKEYRKRNKEKLKLSTEKWISENVERYRETKRKNSSIYRKLHPDKVSKYLKKYKEINKDEISIQRKQHYKDNRDAILKYHKEHKNPEKKAAHERKRRAIKRGCIGNISSELWNRALEFYGNKCLKCGSITNKITLDHVIPLVKGGTNTIENAQPLCLSCNSSKGARHNTDYRNGRIFYG